MSEQPAQSGAPETPRNGRARVVLALLAVVILFLVGSRAGSLVTAFVGWIDHLGPWGPTFFIVGYIAGVVAMLPAVLFTLAAGALFGVAMGTTYVFLAATVGAALSFLIARNFARGAIESRLASYPKFAAIDRAVAAEGRKVVFLLRLSPVFPFVLLNYGLGLTRVSFADFFVASPGMLPGTLLYVYYGSVAGDLARLAGGRPAEKGLYDWLFIALGLAATAAVTALITRTASRALADATEKTAATRAPDNGA